MTRTLVRPSPVVVEHGLRRLLVLGLITTVSGCSLALSGPDPKRATNASPSCDTGKGPVGVDGVMAGVFGIGALSALSSNEPEAAAITALISAAFIASAARGNREVNRCRAAFAQYELRPELADRQQLPEDPYGPTPAPRSRPLEWAPGAGAPRPVLPPPTAPVPPTALPPAGAAAPARPTKPPPPAATDDDEAWADFWTEVP